MTFYRFLDRIKTPRSLSFLVYCGEMHFHYTPKLIDYRLSSNVPGSFLESEAHTGVLLGIVKMTLNRKFTEARLVAR